MDIDIEPPTGAATEAARVEDMICLLLSGLRRRGLMSISMGVDLDGGFAFEMV
jgi:hypothetical protein